MLSILHILGISGKTRKFVQTQGYNQWVKLQVESKSIQDLIVSHLILSYTFIKAKMVENYRIYLFNSIVCTLNISSQILFSA